MEDPMYQGTIKACQEKIFELHQSLNIRFLNRPIPESAVVEIAPQVAVLEDQKVDARWSAVLQEHTLDRLNEYITEVNYAASWYQRYNAHDDAAYRFYRASAAIEGLAIQEGGPGYMQKSITRSFSSQSCLKSFALKQTKAAAEEISSFIVCHLSLLAKLPNQLEKGFDAVMIAFCMYPGLPSTRLLAHLHFSREHLFDRRNDELGLLEMDGMPAAGSNHLDTIG
jgi:hypothetical protein